jgi:RNA polymerase sigma factor (sigma-70 family)
MVMVNGRQAPFAGRQLGLASGATLDEWSDALLLDAFVRRREEAAFAALLRRHGPMVLGVCRRVLRHADDAEDAFQATFLVLVHKAAHLQQPELLASWLHGVAYRTAQHARVRAARRHRHEREAASMNAALIDNDPAWPELREHLDEELQLLPELYRAPLVLCYLEGKTNIEAARILGWPPGSMSARLAKGRELLRQRLTRRRRALGIMLPFVLPQHVHVVTVPGALLEGTLQAVRVIAEGGTLATDAIASGVRELAEAALQSLPGRRRWRWALIVAVMAVLLGLAGAAYAYNEGWPRGESPGEATTSPCDKTNSGSCH